MELPHLDAAGRERLLWLYTRDLPLDLAPDPEVITRSYGVTASFMRELFRRAVLAVDPHAPVVIDGTLLAATPAEVSAAPHKKQLSY